MLKNSTALLSLLAVSTACGHNSKQSKTQDIPTQSFSSDTPTYASYSSIPLDERCEGILNYLSQLRDSSGTKPPISDLSCDIKPLFNELRDMSMLDYDVKFNIEVNSEKTMVYLVFGNETIRLKYFEDGNLVFPTKNSITSSKQATIAGIEKALVAWYVKDVQKSKTIFNESYESFARDLIASYADAEVLPRTTTKVKLIPSKDSELEGTVKFVEVGSEALSKNFLNCEDQACLESAEIRYNLEENRLMIFNAKSIGNDSAVYTQVFVFGAE